MTLTNAGLKALTVPEEQKELEVVAMPKGSPDRCACSTDNHIGCYTAFKRQNTVTLKRTFNQSDFKGGFIKYWRVTGPANHPRLNSDLGVLGLTEAGIIPNKEGK